MIIVRHMSRLTRRQILIKLLEMVISGGIVWLAYHLSHEGEDGMWLVILQALAAQGVALIAFHLLDLFGHCVMMDEPEPDPTIHPTELALRRLQEPPVRNPFLILQLVAGLAILAGIIVLFDEGDKGDIRWSPLISGTVALGITILWVVLHLRRRRELFPPGPEAGSEPGNNPPPAT